MTRVFVTDLFRSMLTKCSGWRPHTGHPDLSVAAVREELRGRDLACWCPLGEPCHADVLLEIANA